MNNHDKFVEIVEAMKEDFGRFYDKGVNAAGARIRKQMQELATLCKEGRKQVTETKAARAADKKSA